MGDADGSEYVHESGEQGYPRRLVAPNQDSRIRTDTPGPDYPASIMPESRISVSFTPRVVDLWRASLVLLFGRPIRLIVLSGIPILVGTLDAIWVNGDESTTIAIVVGFFGGFWLVLPLLTFLITLRHRESRQWRTISVTEDGISIKKSDSENDYQWGAFDRIRSRARGYLFTLVESRGFLWIPSDSFASPADEAVFERIVASHQGLKAVS